MACSPSQQGEEPVLGQGVSQGGSIACPLYALADFSPLALHSPILMSSSTTSWKASSVNTRARHGNEMLPHRKRRNSGSRFQFEAEEELGAELDLPAELVHFIAEGVPTPTKNPQHSLAPAGGAQPKILVAASSGRSHSWSWTRTGRERPDPIRYSH